MNRPQTIAFEHPCRLAFETAHPRFGFLDPEMRHSVVLTINSGYE
jgi:hypothetical protein